MTNAVNNRGPTANGTPDPQRDVIADAGRAVFDTARHAAGNAAATVQETGRAVGSAVRDGVAATWAVLSRKRFWLVVLAWLLRLTCLPILGMTYTVISAEGLRSMLGTLAVPLYKAMPVLSFLGRWRETRRINVAVVMSLVLMAGSWVAWGKVIPLYLRGEQRLSNEEKLIWAVGGCLLVCDGILFLLGVLAGGGFLVSSGTSAVAAVVLTLLYMSLLVLASYLVHWLER